MKRFSVVILFAFIASAIFSSCKKSNKIGRYIPNDAAIVFHVNGDAITSKLPWSEIKQNEIFSRINADTTIDATVKSAFENPESTGIDLKNDITLYIKKDSSGGYAVLQGNVNDIEKFKTFYNSINKGTVVTGKDGNNSIANDSMAATWNKERFAIVFDIPGMKERSKIRIREETDSLVVPVQPVEPVIRRDMQALSSLNFNLEEKNSLGKEEKFSDLLGRKGDVHFWVNVNRLNEGSAGASAMSMMNISKLYEGSILSGSATFVDGKIEMDMVSYAGEEMTDLFKKYEGDDFNADMVKKIPPGNLAMLIALNFKPEGLRAFIRLAGLEGFANMGASYLGITVDDFINANKGDVLVAMTDMTKDSVGRPTGNFLFSASINDTAAFNKLVAAGKKASEGKMMNNLPSGIYYKVSGNNFAIGNKQPSVDAYHANKGNDHTFLPSISGSPFGMYVNFQYMMRASPPVNADSSKMAGYNATLQMWDYLTVKGGEFKDGGLIQHAEINLVDKKTNSLRQLNTFFNTLAQIEKTNKSQRNSGYDSLRMNTDTTVAFSLR